MSEPAAVSPAPRPTIYDVAELAGVSKSLVSLVLRGSERVSPTRREAVLDAIRRLDYRPSQAATLLASRRSHAIQVVIDDYRNPWFVDLLTGLRRSLNGEGYRLTVVDRSDTLDDGGCASPVAVGVDGLIIACDPDETLLTGWAGPTVVAGWRQGEAPGADHVASDEDHGSQLAVAHLQSLGHHAIGHLTGEGGAAVNRRRAFVDAVTQAGVDGVVCHGGAGTSEIDGHRAAGLLLRDNPRVTAIYAANDSMALGALAACGEHGLAVPSDVSVIGYDDTPLARARYINLTTIDDRSVEVGEAAGHALLSRISGPGRDVTQLLIEPALVVRGTTGPARARSLRWRRTVL